MNRSIIYIVLVTTSLWPFCGLAAESAASSLRDDDLLQVRFEQKIGRQVSLDLPFRDENGNNAKLGDYFRGRPVILLLGYYECPMLCTLTLNGLVAGLLDLKTSAGKDFDVVNVSIDPAESPALALAKKKNYLKSYRRPGAEQGWHFLTGKASAIERLTSEVGLHYAYDPHVKQYAHPAGFIVLTPDGRVSQYFFGVKYSAAEINAALHQAGTGKTGSLAQQFLLLCFHYSPLTGKYGNLIMAAVRITGGLTLLVLGLLMVPGFQRRRRKTKEAHP